MFIGVIILENVVLGSNLSEFKDKIKDPLKSKKFTACKF